MDRVLILTADSGEELEVYYMLYRLREAGYGVDVAAPQRKRLELGRLQPEIGTNVGQSCRQDTRGEAKPRSRPQHGLIRQVEHELGLQLAQGDLEIVVDGDPVIGLAAELLGPARHQRADELVGQLGECVADGRGIVLAVDQSERPNHRVEVTSSSIRAVYFSKALVSVENWMIRSCPWNGYLRQTSTWWSLISIRL